MKITDDQLKQIIKEELDAVLDEKKGKKRKAAKKKKSKKKKKAKAKKKDACYNKVKSRYDVWPSAYASGALVKCRKVGAANWGNSTNEDLIGGVHQIDADDNSTHSFATQVGDAFHQITFDGTTTGRGGSKVTVTNIAADKWHVQGTVICSGTPATPFS